MLQVVAFNQAPSNHLSREWYGGAPVGGGGRGDGEERPGNCGNCGVVDERGCGASGEMWRRRCYAVGVGRGGGIGVRVGYGMEEGQGEGYGMEQG